MSGTPSFPPLFLLHVANSLLLLPIQSHKSVFEVFRRNSSCFPLLFIDTSCPFTVYICIFISIYFHALVFSFHISFLFSFKSKCHGHLINTDTYARTISIVYLSLFCHLNALQCVLSHLFILYRFI